MYRILHISDLHRSPDDPIDNSTLIASLDQDFSNQKNENPKINSIDAIIVSGDIVQGVKVGEVNAEKKLKDQYETAAEFLNQLVNRYLDSDKKKIVIVPGNHDVNWNKSISSMEEVTDPPPNGHLDLGKYIYGPESKYRFSMADRKLYRIVNKGLYNSRFEVYEKFYCSFYKDIDLAFDLNSNEYYNLFELDSRKIIVAGFNSCYRNDCFRYVGTIPEGVIGSAYLKIKDSGQPYLLKIAVWHHSINGPPEQSDYMDVKLVQEMINLGFRLGIHGHQHRTEVSPQTISVPSEATMALVSAGSLCVDSSELPPGERRQYNIIEIAEDYESARVHVRQMVSGHVFGPRYFEEFGGKSYTEVSWSPEISSAGTPIDKASEFNNKRVLEAEVMIRNGNQRDAINILSSITELPTHGRRLLLVALEDVSNWVKLVKVFSPPESIQELVSLVSAYCELRKYDDAMNAIDNYSDALKIDRNIKNELLKSVQANRDIHS